MSRFEEMQRLAANPVTRPDTCEIHGEFSARKLFGNTWTVCPKCTEEKRAEEERQKAELEQRARVAAWQRKIGESGIPMRFRDRTLNSFIVESVEQKSALEFSQRYADTFNDVLKTGRSAIFCGLPGTGKTHLAAGISLQVMACGSHSVLFTTVLRAIRRVKDTWGKGAEETESKAIEALVFPDLLILDEIGVQFGSETEKLILFDILNERYEHRKPVILISNLDIDGVKAYLGERIFDRLREDGGQYKAFTWSSYRGRAAS